MQSAPSSLPASAPPTSTQAVLDACHQDILVHLAELTILAERLSAQDVDAQCRAMAERIEKFFSKTSRAHHAMEERSIFPPLLRDGSDEMVHAVRSLQQDHGWIEENWIELSPQLAAIAAGQVEYDLAEFTHAAEMFGDLCREHIQLEESMIYPVARAQRVV